MALKKIAIIGLGYVGLPLAIEFAKKREVVGFDINENRIKDLQNNIDSTKEVSVEELKNLNNLLFTPSKDDISDCQIYIITVPTPVHLDKGPNLGPLINASKLVGKYLKKGDIVIYESTVYPGATEEECVPVLENSSDLTYNQDFFCGYSPERINPGDKARPVTKIKKITSGSNERVANEIDALYQEIITAGTFKASSIRVAEAAKVIENTQRDLNIALMNELSMIFNQLDINTEDVLEAAGTKWNFLPFKPGLVGGHCIGVDPYYLIHKAESVGVKPNLIHSARQVNEGMGSHITKNVLNLLKQKGITIKGSKILIMGITFKENCPDIRNSKSEDLFKIFNKNNFNCKIHDPEANPLEMTNKYGKNYIKKLDSFYDAIIIAVGHDEYLSLNLDTLTKPESIVFDVKSIFPKTKGYLRL